MQRSRQIMQRAMLLCLCCILLFCCNFTEAFSSAWLPNLSYKHKLCRSGSHNLLGKVACRLRRNANMRIRVGVDVVEDEVTDFPINIDIDEDLLLKEDEEEGGNDSMELDFDGYEDDTEEDFVQNEIEGPEPDEESFTATINSIRINSAQLSTEEVRSKLLPWMDEILQSPALEVDKLNDLLTVAMSWRLSDFVIAIVNKCLQLEEYEFSILFESNRLPDFKRIVEFLVANDKFEQALKVVDELMERNVRVRKPIFITLLQGCRNSDNFFRVLLRMRKPYITLNLEILTSVIYFMDWKSALKLLDLVDVYGWEANEAIYCAAISVVTEANRMDVALDLLHRMKQKKISPRYPAYSHLVVGCARNNKWGKVLVLMDELVHKYKYVIHENTLSSVISHLKRAPFNQMMLEIQAEKRKSWKKSGISLQVLNNEDTPLLNSPSLIALELLRNFGNYTKKFTSYSIFIDAIEIAESRQDWDSAYSIYDEMKRFTSDTLPPVIILTKLIKAAALSNNSITAVNILREARSNSLDISVLYEETLESCFYTNNVEDALELINYKLSHVRENALNNAQKMLEKFNPSKQAFGLETIATFISLGLKEVVKDYNSFIVSASSYDTSDTANTSIKGTPIVTSTTTPIVSHRIKNPGQFLKHLVNLMRYLFAMDISYTTTMLPMIHYMNYLLLDCGEYDLVRKILRFYIHSAQSPAAPIPTQWKRSRIPSFLTFPTNIDAAQLSHIYDNATHHLVRFLQYDISNVTNLNEDIDLLNPLNLVSPSDKNNVLDVLTTWIKDLVSMKEHKLATSLFRQGIQALASSFQDIGNTDSLLQKVSESLPSNMPWEAKRSEILKRDNKRRVTGQRNGMLLYQFIKSSHDIMFEHGIFPGKTYQIAVLIFAHIQAYDQILELYRMAAEDEVYMKKKALTSYQVIHKPNPAEVAGLLQSVIQAFATAPETSTKALELLSNEFKYIPVQPAKNEVNRGTNIPYLFQLAIQSCRYANQSQLAMQYYNRMLRYGLEPNKFTLKQLLYSLTQGNHPTQQIFDIVAKMKSLGMTLDEEVCRVLIKHFIKIDKVDEAMTWFDQMTCCKLKYPVGTDLKAMALSMKTEAHEKTNNLDDDKDVSSKSIKRTSKRKAKKEETKLLKEKEGYDPLDEALFDDEPVAWMKEQLEYEQRFAPDQFENRNLYTALIDKLCLHGRFEEIDNVYLQALSTGVFQPFESLEKGAVDLFDHSLPLIQANLRLIHKAARDSFEESPYCRKEFYENLQKKFAEFQSILSMKREYRLKSSIIGTMDELLYIRIQADIAPFNTLLDLFSTQLHISPTEIIGEFAEEDHVLSFPRIKLASES